LFGTGKVADLIEKHVKKGSEIAIQGKLTQRSFTDKDGEKKLITEVEIREILLLSKD
jgi:single-strand DNA-binding protein